MHPNHHDNHNQNVAKATVPIDSSTIYHYHKKSEEIYHITQGRGVVSIGKERVEVTQGDTVCIPPGIPDNAQNTGGEDLKFLCVSTPPYQYEDTFLVNEQWI